MGQGGGFSSEKGFTATRFEFRNMRLELKRTLSLLPRSHIHTRARAHDKGTVAQGLCGPGAVVFEIS